MNLGDTKYVSKSKYFESCYYFDLELLKIFVLKVKVVVVLFNVENLFC